MRRVPALFILVSSSNLRHVGTSSLIQAQVVRYFTEDHNWSTGQRVTTQRRPDHLCEIFMPYISSEYMLSC